ncbi:hypothetical protein V1514DRAFT_337176 [Lipomyces japonicus]|uniref:uncharacterized protein n=1 Tax=Lipomyces japonicus TaxID=56871 RepID=UPI0034CE3404
MNDSSYLTDRVSTSLASSTASTASSFSENVIIGSSITDLPAPQKVQRLFQKARTAFINRQFANSYTLIQTLLSRSSTSIVAPIVNNNVPLKNNIWILYVTLIENILSLSPEESKSLFSKADLAEFSRLVKEFSVWNVVHEAFENSSPSLELIYAVAHAGAQQSLNPELVRQRINLYVNSYTGSTQDSFFLRLLELHALVILPACERWNDAQEFVADHDEISPDRKQQLLNKIIEMQAQIQEKRAKRIAKENERAARRKKRKEAQEAAKAERESEASAVVRRQHDSLSASGKLSDAQDASLGTVRFWKTILLASKRPEVLRRIIAFILIAFALGVPRNRARLLRTLSGGWGRLARTISMAVKVRYL